MNKGPNLARNETMCPFLMEGWTAHFGEWDNMGKVTLYCYCADDCGLFDQQTRQCAIKTIAMALTKIAEKVNK